MRLLIIFVSLSLGTLLWSFHPGNRQEITSFAPQGDFSRDSIVTCADSIYKKYTMGLREFNDISYLGPYKPDSVRWLNLCGKNMSNKQLDGKLLNKMKNLQVLDLGFRDTYTITTTVLNADEPSEAKKKKLDKEVAGGWQYYYQSRKSNKETVEVSRMGNNISQLPKEMASLKKLKLLILCGNPIPSEEVTRLRKALPNTLIIFDN